LAVRASRKRPLPARCTHHLPLSRGGKISGQVLRSLAGAPANATFFHCHARRFALSLCAFHMRALSSVDAAGARAAHTNTWLEPGREHNDGPITGSRASWLDDRCIGFNVGVGVSVPGARCKRREYLGLWHLLRQCLAICPAPLPPRRRCRLPHRLLPLEHDPENAYPGFDPGWTPVFRKDHAQLKNQRSPD
jgi:hypothetical protein